MSTQAARLLPAQRFLSDHWNLGRPSSCQASLVALALLAALWVPVVGFAKTPADYDSFREYRFAGPIALPEGGIEWQLDEAHWRLETGKLWLMEPAVGGAITGIVFEGVGHFRLPVPDRRELLQLRRFSERPSLAGLDEPFSELVIRTSGQGVLPPALVDLARGAKVYSPLRQAKQRHERWWKLEARDIDARVVAGLHIAGDVFLCAAIKTDAFDWLTYEYDSSRPEEIEVTRLQPSSQYAESWLSLDRSQDRGPKGRPTSPWTDAFALDYLTAVVDAREPGKGATRGVGDVNPVNAEFETTARFRSTVDGLGALMLSLTPTAEVEKVTTTDGLELEIVRSHFRDSYYDGSLVVLLPEPLDRGREIELVFHYQMELDNYASLRSWYPSPRSAGLERHGMRLELTHRKDYAVKSVGRLVEETSTDGGNLTIYQTERPLHGGAFTLARLPYEKSFEYPGLPEIVMFGTQAGYLSAEKIESFAPDIINAVNFFQLLFDSPIDSKQLRVTLIASGHGQAMEGMLHVSDSIAQAAYAGQAITGSREAFLAHEVAHEWWGHQVSWSSYRDQWLSEGFAEYSAMMFVEASLEDGPKIFHDIVRSYNSELTGSLGNAFGAFSRPGLAMMNKAGRKRIGPIGHGQRAGTGEAPAAYVSMAYSKGALVLHMLRSILRTITGSDDAFVDVLRDFVASHRGGAASTADFQAALTRHAPSDWDWFFDQWVYGTAIPTYSWSHRVKKAGDGKWLLELTVEQSEVPAGFKSPIPVRAEFAGGQSGELVVMMDQPKKTFQLTLPAKPKKVVLNPDYAILAKMK